jgi:hypothetical protein
MQSAVVQNGLAKHLLENSFKAQAFYGRYSNLPKSGRPVYAGWLKLPRQQPVSAPHPSKLDGGVLHAR